MNVARYRLSADHGLPLDLLATTPRSDCAAFVGLAQRMSVSTPDAIRQFMDLTIQTPPAFTPRLPCRS